MADGHKPVILIADDDPEILSLLSIRLSRTGYKVLEAVDGEQTLSAVREHFPDLIILDVMMPERTAGRWPRSCATTRASATSGS